MLNSTYRHTHVVLIVPCTRLCIRNIMQSHNFLLQTVTRVIRASCVQVHTGTDGRSHANTFIHSHKHRTTYTCVCLLIYFEQRHESRDGSVICVFMQSFSFCTHRVILEHTTSQRARLCTKLYIGTFTSNMLTYTHTYMKYLIISQQERLFSHGHLGSQQLGFYESRERICIWA